MPRSRRATRSDGTSFSTRCQMAMARWQFPLPACLLVGEGFGEGFVAGPQHGHEQVPLAQSAIARVVDRDSLAGPVHEELLPRHMHMAQHRIERSLPLPIQFADRK